MGASRSSQGLTISASNILVPKHPPFFGLFLQKGYYLGTEELIKQIINSFASVLRILGLLAALFLLLFLGRWLLLLLSRVATNSWY